MKIRISGRLRLLSL